MIVEVSMRILPTPINDDPEPKTHKVVLVVLSSTLNLSPQSIALKLADMSVGGKPHLAPIPLPVPTVPHANKREVRSVGALVASWGTNAKIQLLEVEHALPGQDEDHKWTSGLLFYECS